jgi:formate dehydrogenase major subunit
MDPCRRWIAVSCGLMNVWPRDLIRLQTRRGAVEMKVRSDRDVPEDMVFMPFCYAEAAANLLTNPALDPFGKIPEFKFCAVRAERADI